MDGPGPTGLHAGVRCAHGLAEDVEPEEETFQRRTPHVSSQAIDRPMHSRECFASGWQSLLDRFKLKR